MCVVEDECIYVYILRLCVRPCACACLCVCMCVCVCEVQHASISASDTLKLVSMRINILHGKSLAGSSSAKMHSALCVVHLVNPDC